MESYGYPGVSEIPRAIPRRRRRWPRRVIIALVILLILLFAADRIGLVVAENLVADRVQQSQSLAGKPSVSIGGFPFLTQLVSEDFGNVTVDADGITRNGLHITTLHANLGSVRPNAGYSSARVATLNGTAFFNLSDLGTTVASVSGTQITFSPGSNGMLSASLTVAGQRINALATVTVVQGNEIAISAQGFTVRIPLGGLPFGLKVTDVAVETNGISVTATAQDVVLSNSGVSAGN
jgi:hypothetical protein